MHSLNLKDRGAAPRAASGNEHALREACHGVDEGDVGGAPSEEWRGGEGGPVEGDVEWFSDGIDEGLHGGCDGCIASRDGSS